MMMHILRGGGKETPVDLKNLDDVKYLYHEILAPAYNKFEAALMKGEELSAQEMLAGQVAGTWVANDYLRADSDLNQMNMVRRTASFNSFKKDLLPLIEQKVSTRAVECAVFHFAKDIDKNFEGRTEEQKQELLDVVKGQPKETLALYLISAQNKDENKPEAKIFNKADLETKLSSEDIKSVAAEIDIKNLPHSLMKLGKDVKSSDAVSKRQGLGSEMADHVVKRDEQRVS